MGWHIVTFRSKLPDAPFPQVLEENNFLPTLLPPRSLLSELNQGCAPSPPCPVLGRARWVMTLRQGRWRRGLNLDGCASWMELGCRWEGISQLGTEEFCPAKWQKVMSRLESLRGTCLASSCWIDEDLCEGAAP